MLFRFTLIAYVLSFLCAVNLIFCAGRTPKTPGTSSLPRMNFSTPQRKPSWDKIDHSRKNKLPSIAEHPCTTLPGNALSKKTFSDTSHRVTTDDPLPSLPKLFFCLRDNLNLFSLLTPFDQIFFHTTTANQTITPTHQSLTSTLLHFFWGNIETIQSSSGWGIYTRAPLEYLDTSLAKDTAVKRWIQKPKKHQTMPEQIRHIQPSMLNPFLEMYYTLHENKKKQSDFLLKRTMLKRKSFKVSMPSNPADHTWHGIIYFWFKKIALWLVITLSVLGVLWKMLKRSS